MTAAGLVKLGARRWRWVAGPSGGLIVQAWYAERLGARLWWLVHGGLEAYVSLRGDELVVHAVGALARS